MSGTRVVLAVCGGIAAYKAAALASALVQRGDRVDVVMTPEATRFIAPLTFAALTRNAVLTDLWDAPERIPHIDLVRAADVLVIAPATANVIAKLACGIADDLPTSMALAARIPVVIAPAMNSAMYEHPAVRANLDRLHAFGYTLVEPGTGFLAERETGIGRLADLERIVAALDAACGASNELAGERIVITAGPTREPIDPVRYLSNPATGTTGIELARDALRRGGHVDLILGPTHLAAPEGAHVVRIETARELFEAALPLAAGADIVIATAAVCDHGPVDRLMRKAAKGEIGAALPLAPTPDILRAIGEAGHARFLVGFAAQTHDHEAHGRRKLREKHLDAVVVNDVAAAGSGFGVGANEAVVLYGESGRMEIGRASKPVFARRLLNALLAVRAERSA